MTSRLLLTACLMSSLYSQASLASVIIEEANIDKGEFFNRVPTEVIKAHFIPCVPKTALLLNRSFYWLITGYRPDEVGIRHTRRSNIIPPIFWELKTFNDQNKRITRVYTPENISPFLWFHLLGYTQNLSNAFWPYLQGTNVHTVNLARNQIDAQGARDFAQFLQGTNVHTVNLENNEIGDEGARDFAQFLQGTNVHTVNLAFNRIGAQGVRDFAQFLQGTSVHTVYLRNNWIGAQGARDFAQFLQGTNVHTVNLAFNRIGDVTKNFLSEHYSHITWIF